ncbi:gamma-glutamyl-gamma-aminobutyrate hydrolase family protein [Agrobacterium leguminum]|uniref:Gamma-glutamyl-gamma-aminobutyrate hydrolase family protein n=1 Tax=Agrobacterium leguminum TaxID=2792015 RepID=A0A9X3KHC2_9HYPH|nr:gamma-glutamyl-gamma-aminobutyrate hydrolase family protein [Agrobacterium leguminum]MCZ7911489.1 gamma-glutamyl-gamma-aminobutyrate hydrolase family protein [Agrobacterium leguminum]
MTKATLSSPPTVVQTALQILVVGSLRPPGVSDKLRNALRSLADNTRRQLAAYGVRSSFVEASSPGGKPETFVAGKHGVIILGGADVDPSCYGQVACTGTIYGLNPVADKFELELMSSAVKRGIPILGMCRGMQLMNILRGGDLIQDIGAETIHVGSAENSVMVSHLVEVVEGSRLAKVYVDKQISVRSAHHQALNRLGTGLRVAAQAADGIIEAVEDSGEHWMVGVQWHPEELSASKQDFRSLIEHFLGAAGDHARLQD